MTTIGRVIYEADIDGRRLPARARAVGRSAGSAMGTEMGKHLDSDFDDALTAYARKWAGRMRANGNISGTSFTQAFNAVIRRQLDNLTADMAEVFGKKGGIEEFAKRFDNAGDAVQRLRDNVARLHSQNLLTDAQYKSLNQQIDKYALGVDELRRAEADAGLERSRQILINRQLGDALDKVYVEKMHRAAIQASEFDLINRRLGRSLDELAFEKSGRDIDVYHQRIGKASSAMLKLEKDSDKASGGLDRQGSAWKRLSANTRQWILIIGFFTAASGEIAALGSFVGSTVTLAASAFASFGIAVGIAVAGLKDLGKPLDELPEGLRPAAEAFQNFTTQLDHLQDRIALNLAPQVVAPFQRLADILPMLNGPIMQITDAVGTLIQNFVNLATTGPNLKKLNDFLGSTATVVEQIGNGLIGFVGGIANVFHIAIPFAEKFATSVNEIGQRFLAWTDSEEGREAITEWFENGQKIAGPFLSLIEEVAGVLNRLVTPEVVDQTAEFLQDLADSMPFFEQLLGLATDLQIFGLIAQILDELGNALTPVLELLRPVADYLGMAVSFAISSIAVALQILTPLLWPFQVGFEILNTVFQKFMEYAQPIIDAILEMGEAIGAELQTALDEVMPSIEAAIDALIDLLPPQEDVVAFIRDQLVPWIRDTLGPALQDWAENIKNVAKWIRDELVPWIRDHLVPWIRDNLVPAVVVAVGVFNSIFNSIMIVVGAIQTAVGWIQTLISWLNSIPAVSIPSGSTGNGSSAPGRNSGGGGGLAAGGMATFAARRLTGEAGTEAIVPLNRPLSLVDQSVRDIAAFAQGKMSFGSTMSKSVTFAPGSIVVYAGTSDATLVAESVLDHVVTDGGL